MNLFDLIKYSQQAFYKKALSFLLTFGLYRIISRYIPWCTIKFLDGGQEVTYPSLYEQFSLYLLHFSKCFSKDSVMTRTWLYFKPFTLLPPSLIHHSCPPPNILTLFCLLLSLIATYISWVRTGDVCILTVRVLYSFMSLTANQRSDILQHSQNRPTGDRWLKF